MSEGTCFDVAEYTVASHNYYKCSLADLTEKNNPSYFL